MTLIRLFDYDLWANRHWLAALRQLGMPEPDVSVFQHILAGQEIWLRRCQGTSLTEMPTPNVDEATLVSVNQAWKELLTARGDDPVISYTRTTGEHLKLHLSQIAHHLCNHGTYHRGELRGLRRAAGDDSFPDTDLSRWIFEVGLNP